MINQKIHHNIIIYKTNVYTPNIFIYLRIYIYFYIIVI
jgi:hypothetical protein